MELVETRFTAHVVDDEGTWLASTLPGYSYLIPGGTHVYHGWFCRLCEGKKVCYCPTLEGLVKTTRTL